MTDNKNPRRTCCALGASGNDCASVYDVECPLCKMWLCAPCARAHVGEACMFYAALLDETEVTTVLVSEDSRHLYQEALFRISRGDKPPGRADALRVYRHHESVPDVIERDGLRQQLRDVERGIMENIRAAGATTPTSP